MIKNWRITSDITLMLENLGNGNNVYIACPEKKQYEAEVLKLSKNIYKIITIENTDLRLKLDYNDSGPILYIKTDKIPGWCKVMNFYEPSIWNIIKQSRVEKGELKETYQAVFSDFDTKTLSFVSRNMNEYKIYLEEMTRRLRCEIGKKTKLLKPGHRYDILKETRYYLCSVKSRKESLGCSDFLSDSKTKDAYIYVNMIKSSDHTVSDVLKSNKFGTGLYDLKIAILDKSTWIDSGEKLGNDFTGNIKDYWEQIIDNSLKTYNKKIEGSEYYTSANWIKEIFEILGCQNSCDLSYTINESLKTKLSDIILDKLEYNLLKFWKLRNKDKNYEILETKPLKENSEALVRIFLSSIYDENINKYSYYDSLITTLGFNLCNLAYDTILNFNEPNLTSDFDSFLRYKFFWENKKYMYDKPVLDFSVNTINGELVRNTIPGLELSSTICELYNYANSNYGIGVEMYEVKDASVVCCKITLSDIVKYKKGVSEMSENLKNEIKNNKFNSILITCKQTDILE